MADPVEKRNVSYAEAIAYANARNIVLPDVYYGKLVGIQRSQAVSVAGLASIDQIKFVVDQLDRVLKEGKTFKDFQLAVKNNELGISLPPHRLDNIFRTNLQASYARGRWEQQTRTAATRPFLMYDAINDGRTRPHHHAMDGTILPKDHAWWTTNYPPNGYRCRCTVISLSAKQAEKRGGVKEPPADATPDEGWNYNPGADYVAPIEKAVEKAAVVAQVRTPAATRTIQKAVAKIKEEAKPITLDSVIERGRKELAALDKGDYGTETFFKRLEDHVISKVTKTKKVERDNIGRVPKDLVSDHAKKHFTGKLLVRTPMPYYSADEFREGVYARLPLPAKWLKGVKKWADRGNVHLDYNSDRAFARQDKRNATLSINPQQGDIVLHEFLHLVQIAVPEVQALCEELHLRRTAGTAQKKLSTLHPHSSYADHEVTKEDQYFDAYAGKEYFHTYAANDRWQPLELLTMGIQALLGDPTSLNNHRNATRVDMFRKDRSTAEFMLGLILSYA